MLLDRLTRDLYAEICRIPLVDPHSHINPLAAASRSLDDILGYHYYTELAHSAGMDQAPLQPGQSISISRFVPQQTAQICAPLAGQYRLPDLAEHKGQRAISAAVYIKARLTLVQGRADNRNRS